MVTAQGTLRMHRDAQTVTFQVEGIARMPQGLALRKAAEKALADGAATLRIDLSGCSYMDSTFVGTLLFFRSLLSRQGRGEITLLSPSEPCRELLQQMGLNALFSIVAAAPPPTVGWTEVPCEPDDGEAWKHQIIDAHQELANLDGPVGESFREVVRCLAQDTSKR